MNARSHRQNYAPSQNIAKDADLLTCIDTAYTALIDAYQHRRDLPDDIRSLLCDAFVVLAVVSAILRRKKRLNGKGTQP
jgi:hypothetical protein